MGVAVRVVPVRIEAVPGRPSTVTVQLRNIGTIVDSIDVDVLGDLAAYATVSPPSVELLPGAESTATIILNVPPAAAVRAGDHVTGVRARCREDAQGSAVEELHIDVSPVGGLSVSVVPRTLTSGQTAQVSVANLGNSPSTITLALEDPEAALSFRPNVNSLPLAAGQTAGLNLRVKAHRRPPRGQTRSYPFRVVARGGQAMAAADATVTVERRALPLSKVLGGLASLTFVAVAVAAGLLFFRQNQGKVNVSDVRELPIAQATAALQGNGFQVGQKLETVADDNQAGIVLDQDPKQNSRAPKASRVILTVGYATPKAKVPDVRRRMGGAATDTLTQMGFFNVRKESRQANSAADTVIDQVPQPGATVPFTQDITLIVSAGPGAVAVPQVGGGAESDARKALAAAGFTNITTTRRNDAAVPKDKIIGTEPSGQATPPNITLVVSDGPAVQVVPQLVGGSLADAQKALLAQGLTLGTMLSKAGPQGQVLAQDPPSGKSVPTGAPVSLTVGQGSGAAPSPTIIDPRLMPATRLSPTATAVSTTKK